MAKDVKHTTNGQATQENVGSTIKEGGEQLKEQVVATSREVKERTQSVIQDSKDRVVTGLSDFASTLHRTNEELKSSNLSPIAQYSEKLESWSQGLADYLQTANPRDMWHDAESLARRQPALFLGGAVLLGLTAARFLKSSGGPHEVNHERS
jgi:hypothetical protein